MFSTIKNYANVKKYDATSKCIEMVVSFLMCLVILVSFCALFDTRLVSSTASSLKRPSWTWLCVDKQCEKYHATKNTTMRSLITCNMLCGSSMLWPQPSGAISYSNSAVAIDPDTITLDIVYSPSREVTEHLKEAFEVTNLYIKKLRRRKQLTYNLIKYKIMKKVVVSISVLKDSEAKLKLSTNEEYTMRIKRENKLIKVIILSNSFCGARHGLVTFSQNIWYEPYASSWLMRDTVKIDDGPKYNYRGLLLDTARNYFPMSDLYKIIDGMGASKLNTFHWHISDSQSFPLKLDSVPQLAKYGAYSPEEVYTTDDVKSLVSYARLRGIRILIEVDAPGHVGKAWSWGPDAGLGDLAHCVDMTPWEKYCSEPPCGQLNPKNMNVYSILGMIYAEIINLTQVDDIFHIGGDEVNDNCWRTFHKEEVTELWLNFTEGTLKVLKQANKGFLPKLTLLWTSGRVSTYFEKLESMGLSFQVWDNLSETVEAQVVISYYDAWYLDCGFGSWTDNKDSHCNFNSWQQMYEFRYWPNTTRKELDWKIFGGEVCQWSETLNSGGLDYRTWPRAAAVAERLWRDKKKRVNPDVYTRLDAHNERLAVYGINHAPLWPKWCVDSPTKCLKNRSHTGKEHDNVSPKKVVPVSADEHTTTYNISHTV